MIQHFCTFDLRAARDVKYIEVIKRCHVCGEFWRIRSNGGGARYGNRIHPPILNIKLFLWQRRKRKEMKK